MENASVLVLIQNWALCSSEADPPLPRLCICFRALCGLSSWIGLGTQVTIQAVIFIYGRLLFVTSWLLWYETLIPLTCYYILVACWPWAVSARRRSAVHRQEHRAAPSRNEEGEARQSHCSRQNETDGCPPAKYGPGAPHCWCYWDFSKSQDESVCEYEHCALFTSTVPCEHWYCFCRDVCYRYHIHQKFERGYSNDHSRSWPGMVIFYISLILGSACMHVLAFKQNCSCSWIIVTVVVKFVFTLYIACLWQQKCWITITVQELVLYLVIQHFCCQSVIKIQFSSEVCWATNILSASQIKPRDLDSCEICLWLFTGFPRGSARHLPFTEVYKTNTIQKISKSLLLFKVAMHLMSVVGKSNRHG